MTVLFPCIIFHKPSVRVWGGQGYPNKHHEHFKVIFSITREEIELPVKIGDKNLNLTQPNMYTKKNFSIKDVFRPALADMASFKNIVKGTTDLRVEFILQDHSSQFTNLEHVQFQNLD